jgi:Ca-activated chloride channel family protein
VALLALLLLPACSSATPTATRPPAQTLRIIAGSENQTLEPLLQEYARRSNLTLELTYKGSVDIMLELERGSAIPYDAVWPANSLWLALGDRQGVVKAQESIWRSPVVFGVKKSVADRLGWVGRDVTVNDLLAASESGQLRFMMSSATQSNSGASAYIGFLYAFAGRPEVLTSDNLKDQGVRDKVKRILGAVNRTAGSSGWLKDLFLDQYGGYDAMVNYEALVIEANGVLTTSGREPLYAVYPVDGLAIADAPLGFVNKGDARKEEAFRNLQAFLLTPETQNRILALGRRVGPLGLNSAQVDRNVFRPEWGIDVARTITPIRFPAPAVTREALTLYQTAFRKPSLTIYCLDFSGSMKGQREQDMKTAMRLLLDQGQAATYLLQASPDDITVVIPFDDKLRQEWTVVGDDPQALNDLIAKIIQGQVGGGTDIYSPASRALEIIKSKQYEDYASAVILLTDGESNTGQKLPDLQRQYSKLGFSNLPIYSILFGEASSKQLQEIATLTSGRVFDGKKNLIDAFREAKGYN